MFSSIFKYRIKKICYKMDARKYDCRIGQYVLLYRGVKIQASFSKDVLKAAKQNHKKSFK